MKNTIPHRFAVCLLVVFVVSTNIWGQGTIVINNINGGGNYFSTTFGRFWDVPPTGAYTATPINVTILGGPDANSLTPIATLSGPNALVAVTAVSGRYTDPSSGIYTIPGVASGQTATLQLLAWRGNATTFFDADSRVDWFWPANGGNPTQFTFQNPTGGLQPASLDGMPAMVRLLDVPEPGSLGLLAVGGLLLGWRLRHKSK